MTAAAPKTVEAARTLARARLAGALPRRWAHTLGVAAAADACSVHLPPAGRYAVAAAAWLHDIGYAPGLADTGFHPLDGARYADLCGFGPLIARLVAHHAGAAEAAERGMAAALAEFPAPPRPLLDALTCADRSAGRGGTPVDPAGRIAGTLSRYPPGHPAHRAVTRSAPGLLSGGRPVWLAGPNDRIPLAGAG